MLPLAVRQLQHSFGGSTYEAAPTRTQPGPGYMIQPPDKMGHQAMPFHPQGPQGRHNVGHPGLPLMEQMALGHQYSFDNDNDVLARQRREQASSCCCCWPCCWQLCVFIVIATALVFFLLYSFVINNSDVEVYQTRFTFWNYALPQLRFLIAGEWDTVSLTQWYHDMADSDPLVGVGPGPNTHTYYGYKTVKSLLQGLGPRIQSGDMERANELGMQILRDDMWPETGRVVFGLDNSDHATVRPFLGDALDRAEKTEETCDGSTCWNLAWLRHVFQERLAGLPAFSSSDLQWMMTIVLHKVLLNIDLSEEEARQFADFQAHLMRVVAFPRNDLWETVLGEFPSKLREQYILNYKAAIAAKWPHVDWSIVQAKSSLLANAIMDTIALHAGPMVSGALEHLLALLYMKGEPGSALVRPLKAQDEAGIQDLIWETLRRYPPAAGVPYWARDKDHITWTHEIPNLQMALQDPSVFPEPLEFRLGRPGLSHANNSLSIGFADFALVEDDVSNRDSHACPGKRLSLALLQAFLQEFSAYNWKVDNSNIRLNSFASSGFTLRKAV
mmetsp:Transcript_57338/g.167838  ORF Transcript_57338/g.167838 Transcript_57338/m.167838 type:complete len:557 (+) Transcript_57338:43-1713(+)